MVDNSALVLTVADFAYSGGDTAKILKFILRKNLQIDLQIVPLADVMTTVKRLKPNLLIIGHRPLLEDDMMRGRWQAAGSPTGSDIVRALKSDAESKNVPILMLESLIDREKVVQECGADGYLRVPFGPQEFLDAIKPWIAANTKVLTSAQLDLAAQLLREHRLVAFPTDTVYGLGALAFDGPTALKLYIAKERPPEKAIPILIADIADLEQVALNVPPLAYRLMKSFWPGALTVVVPKHPRLPPEVSATDTVAVRMPDLDLARNLIRLTGPLAVTSANRSAGPNPRTAQEVLDQLGGRVDAIVDGGQTPGGVPSTVLDCTPLMPLILREGAIADRVRDFLAQAL